MEFPAQLFVTISFACDTPRHAQTRETPFRCRRGRLADLPACWRRRTFAIISHPDAGKTTLTEKLLLFGGADPHAAAHRCPDLIL